MKKVISLLMIFAICISFTACISNPKPAKSKYSLDKFITLLKQQYGSDTQSELARKHPDVFWQFDDPSYPNAKLDDFSDITPEEVETNVGCQIFKNKTTPISFILYNNVLYPIAAPLYGAGILDIKTCDFDSNGQTDIIYSVSWSASGIYMPSIAYFNLTNFTEIKVYSSQKFEDYMLKKINNQTFDVYTIDKNTLSPIETDTNIFDQSKFSSDKKIGSITNENSTPTIHIL